LPLAGGTLTSDLIINKTGGAVIRLQNNDASNATDQPLGRIEWYNQDGSNAGPNAAAIIEAQAGPSLGANANLVFKTYVAATEGADASTSMTLDYLGNLSVTGSIASQGPDGGMVMRTWQAGSTYGMIGTANMASQEYALLTDGTDTLIGGGSGGYTYIRSGNNDFNPQLVINGTNSYFDGGNVGIGTTSPGVKLDVVGEIRGTSLIVDGTYDGNFGFPTFSWSGSSIYPTLYSSHPDRWIMLCEPHVTYLENGTNGFTGETGGATIKFASNAAASYAWSIGVNANGNVSADKWSIVRETSPLITVDNTGSFGIGVTSPSYKLDVSGTGRFSDSLYGTNASFSDEVAAVTFKSNALGTATTDNSGWFKIGKIASRGGGIITLSFTGGSYTPVTYVII
jgi:hypothetical protein